MKTSPVKKIFVPFDERPRCEVEGCDRPAQLQQTSKTTGMPMWRRTDGKYICSMHHSERIAIKHGVSSIAEVIAKNAGFASASEYINSKHRYRCNRKDYCQNCTGEAVWVDPDTGEHKPLHEHSRVGNCTATITDASQLSVDHINGDHDDDRPENHQTLCHNCHKVKSLISKDHWSNEKKRKHRENLLSSTSLLAA